MKKLSIGLCVAGLMFGCGGGGGGEEPADQASTDGTEGGEAVEAQPDPEPEPPPPPAPAQVRVIHAAAGAATTALSGTAGSASVAGLAFKAASAYTEVPLEAAGATVAVSIAAEGGTAATHSATPAAGARMTLVAITSATAETELSLVALDDDPHAVTGQIRGRFVHALHGAAEVDVCVAPSAREGGRPAFTNIAYGGVGGIDGMPGRYQPILLAGVTHIQIRQHSEQACSGRLIGVAPVPQVDSSTAHNFTLVAVGRTSRRPALARELLMCDDSPAAGACQAIPLAAR